MPNQAIVWVLFVIVLLPVMAVTTAILYAVVVLCADKIQRQEKFNPP